MNFPPFTNLTTERLILRELRLTDAHEIFLLRSNERVNELIDRVTATSIDEAHQFINMIISNQLNNESFMWVITLKDEPKLIGTIVYWNIIKEKDQAEIGYELLPQFHSKGIMQEALLKVIDFGFKTLGLKTILAEPKANNQPSVKLLEKCGFVKTGETEDSYLVYELDSF
ncbi:GNAT family N-acetyltransferase [Mucilaginibacter sp. McL0603]|uniref:GNAT family N-acetyltransferase n=1 Tax=Mucilaginibacter sp. McL0603 TaxID=3415670 RepID=UPI003CF3711A